jgi:dTDP-4-dehydrorhamnose reductase
VKVVIAGSKGQLGFELIRTAPEAADLACLYRPSVDISDAEVIRRQIKEIRPDWIINAAAYTNVDKAETDEKTTFRTNHLGAKTLADQCQLAGCNLVHISTDFVFDGFTNEAYSPTSATNPLSVYGKSKREGEIAVMQSHPPAIIVRTSWMYSSHGDNFVKTMLRLMKRGDPLSVVADQFGTPTWANSLAQMIWALTSSKKHLGEIIHFADAGSTTWYDFAVAINEEATAIGLLNTPVEIIPIRSIEYKLPASRPSFSVLNRESGWTVNGRPLHWRQNLRLMLNELKSQEYKIQ